MHTNPTDDQRLFTDTTRRFLAETCAITAVRACADEAAGFHPDWWQRGSGLGWTSLLAPDRLGGGGVSDAAVSDLIEIAFERGRCVAPGPFTATNVAVAVLAAASGEQFDDLIGSVMSGERFVAVAAEARGARWPGNRLGVTARHEDGEILLDGTSILVEAAGQSGHLLVLAGTDDGIEFVLVPVETPGVTVVGRDSVDLVRRFADVEFDRVRVPTGSLVLDDRDTIERCLDIGTILQAAETVGALDRVFEFTLQWSFDRYTFGRPLASYQELKHRFADMKLWLEGSNATVVEAARALSHNRPDSAELVSTAASYVNSNGPELVQDCVQMHGGLGVTWEHDIHLFLRRVTINSLTWGTVSDHRERLATIILTGVSEGVNA